LGQLGTVLRDATVSLVDLRKTSQNPVRLWSIDDFGNVINPLEGTVLRLNSSTLVVASTGSATLHQGTANPFVLVTRDGHDDIDRAGYAVLATSQLNWSSPRVAQRLPIHVKNSDELLQNRAAQLVRGFR
jgi:argonaute-like protein implicated in RNA metabolism and viral defense